MKKKRSLESQGTKGSTRQLGNGRWPQVTRGPQDSYHCITVLSCYAAYFVFVVKTHSFVKVTACT
jgi:hypothetical protein